MSKSSSTKQTFRLTAPDATRVLLVGDFTQWQDHPIPLRRNKQGVWSASVRLDPGKHPYRFIVDGVWRDDPSCALRVPNMFGSEDMIREAA